MVIKNRKGWIKIVEAAIAIILLASVVIIVIGNMNVGKSDFSSRVHNDEISILRGIELDNSLRSEVVATSGKVEWANLPAGTKAKIIAETPSYLTCEAKICSPESSCLLAGSPDGNVYTEGIIINSDVEEYEPRALKIFCWEN
ncbi:MAG: hypothetical protein KJ905_03735 [Nanoarchaeota archaeon]|nr:hypothetical protein [Nanoarchaeota archaeon]MBU1501852.1 hypothetical protein [Nanoarchaeota archaeon]MBU2458737.1 hypothetical protein [Nanoarchaeota archaeon]